MGKDIFPRHAMPRFLAGCTLHVPRPHLGLAIFLRQGSPRRCIAGLHTMHQPAVKSDSPHSPGNSPASAISVSHCRPQLYLCQFFCIPGTLSQQKRTQRLQIVTSAKLFIPQQIQHRAPICLRDCTNSLPWPHGLPDIPLTVKKQFLF